MTRSMPYGMDDVSLSKYQCYEIDDKDEDVAITLLYSIFPHSNDNSQKPFVDDHNNSYLGSVTSTVSDSNNATDASLIYKRDVRGDVHNMFDAVSSLSSSSSSLLHCVPYSHVAMTIDRSLLQMIIIILILVQ